MPITLAKVRDLQSAEHLKSRALGERAAEDALPLWRAARKLDPRSPTLACHEGMALLDLERPAPACELLLRAFESAPRHAHLANLLGVALHRLGGPEARACFEHALFLDPDYPSARESLSRCGPARPSPLAARIEAACEAARQRPAQTLAVCMIVKDEAEFIAGALASVRGLATEVIVVDTGSSDDTVALAEAGGARVETFAWTGDFAEARNVSLSFASADWILVLDADERVTAAARTAIRIIMEEFGVEQLRVVCPRIRNLTRAGVELNDGFSGRLFRNDPRLRFSGRVHEEVGRGRNDVSTDYRLDVVLDHYGADPEVMVEKAKDERNIELLEARLAEAPDDLLTWFYLGSQHWVGNRPEDARAAFERVVELFARDPGRYGVAVRNVPVPYSYVGLVRLMVNAADDQAALEVGDRGLALFADNPDLWFHTAFALIGLEDHARARDYLLRARDAKRTGYALISMNDAEIQTWKASKTIADIDFEAGDAAAAYAGYCEVAERVPEAEQVVLRARLVELASSLGALDALAEHTLRYLSLRPEKIEVALQVARQLGAAQGLQAAYDLLTRLYAEVEAVREDVRLALAIGSVAEQAQEDAEALRWYELVASMDHADPAFWANLAQVLLRQGRQEEALQAAELARKLSSA